MARAGGKEKGEGDEEKMGVEKRRGEGRSDKGGVYKEEQNGRLMRHELILQK